MWLFDSFPYGQKLDHSGVCFGWYVLALSVRKRIFLKTKKADQKQCENWRRESGSEFQKTSPTCERGEWRKQLQDLSTQSLKQTPLSSCAIARLFWPNALYTYVCVMSQTYTVCTHMCLMSQTYMFLYDMRDIRLICVQTMYVWDMTHICV